METEKETRVLKNSIYHNFDGKIELKSIHREVSKVVINFTYACGICELPTALKKIMYNGKNQKEFKYAYACNYIKCSASQYLSVTKLKLSLIYEV